MVLAMMVRNFNHEHPLVETHSLFHNPTPFHTVIYF